MEKIFHLVKKEIIQQLMIINVQLLSKFLKGKIVYVEIIDY